MGESKYKLEMHLCLCLLAMSEGASFFFFFFRTKLAFIYYFVSAGKEMISRFLLHWLLAVTADLWHRALAANIKNITV